MSATAEAESLLDQLSVRPVLVEHAPSMRQIEKVSYTHQAMIDLIIATPAISQGELAKHFGYTPAWICQVIASDSFQMQLAQRKDELVDPVLRMGIEERFKALVKRSLDVLQEKLAQETVKIPDNLALRCAELGARSLGLGRDTQPGPPPAGDRLTILANRLILLQDNVRGALHGESRREEATEATVVSLSGADHPVQVADSAHPQLPNPADQAAGRD